MKKKRILIIHHRSQYGGAPRSLIENLNMSKKRFFIFGLFNVLSVNIILQILLKYLQTSLATLISQIFGMILGFFLYVGS